MRSALTAGPGPGRVLRLGLGLGLGVVAALAWPAGMARADDPAPTDGAAPTDDEPTPVGGELTPLGSRPVPTAPRPPRRAPAPVVGFRVEGDSKLTDLTLARMARVERGQLIDDTQVPEIVAALTSTELFKQVAVRLEPAAGGVIVVANLTDKLSWIVAPTLFVLGESWAAGLGFVENNLFGEDKKLLLYGQLGSSDTFFYGTYLDPALAGSRLSLRLDVYTQRKISDEYANPDADPRSTAIARTTTFTFLNAGVGLGWRFRWWLTSELRLRGASASYADTHAGGDPSMALPAPSPDGRDVTGQARLTLDRRGHDFGLTWGPYAQLYLESYLPVLSTYRFADATLRAYYSWILFRSHQLELRASGSLAVHVPYNEEWTLGAASDLRGYASNQFRGDTRVFGRAEYSVGVARWRMLKLRALGFVDAGYLGFHHTGADPDRAYLPDQVGNGRVRSDVGGGIRVYVNSVVLPLLGFDVGYGLEGHAPVVYFELGLTDF